MFNDAELKIEDVNNMSIFDAQDWVAEHAEEMNLLTDEICALLLEKSNPVM